ncbi:peptidylprolyl isomerase [[Brevibacterium] frigoritolerans]|nr:peptidylprolyl isomerase [Peribacillus frigoritolerans]
MKKILTTLTLGISVLGLAACSSGNEVVVKSTAGNITQEEFYQELVKTNGPAVLENLINAKVLEEKYSVSDKEVNKELEKVKGQFGSDEEFLAALNSSGIKDEKTFKAQLKISLLQKEAVTDGIKVTDKQLKEYYSKNKDQFITVKAQHILVADENKAKELKQKLENGADFAKLAKENSTDTASAQEGGTLGEFKKGQMVAEFDEVAFTIKPGTISEPIKSQFGYHIIKVNERNEKSFEKAKTEVENLYLAGKAKPYTDVIKKIKEDAKVEIKDEKLKKAVDELILNAAAQQQQTQQ